MTSTDHLTPEAATGMLSRARRLAAEMRAAGTMPTHQPNPSPDMETPEEAAARVQAGRANAAAPWTSQLIGTEYAGVTLDTEHFTAQRVAEMTAAMKNSRIIVIQGSIGVGKTYLAYATATTAARWGKRIEAIGAADLAVVSMSFSNWEARKADLLAADVLIIDDFGASDPHPNSLAAINELLDARRVRPALRTIITTNADVPKRRLESTIVTTNADGTKIRKENGPMARTWDRLAGAVITITGTSRRV